jgi:hypothetical protein
MTEISKVAMFIVAVAMVTTLVLPGRLTPQVISAGGKAFQGSLATAITGKK